MSAQDDTPGLALAVSVLTAALVVAGTLGLAIATSQRQLRLQAESPAEAAGLGPVEAIMFEAGSAALPSDAREAIDRAAEAVLADGSLVVLVLAFHAAGDAQGSQLAAQRARAIGHALQADGVPAQRIVLARPEPLAPGRAETADRVEIRLQ